MPFVHENTWGSFASRNAEEELHAKFENAVDTLLEEIRCKRTKFFNRVGEERREAISYFDSFSPIDIDLVMGRFPLGTCEDVEEAVKAAARAFNDWRRTDLKERIRILRKAADIIRKEKFKIAALLTLANGKVRREAIGEVDMGVDYIEYYTHEMERNNGYNRQMPSPSANEDASNVFLPYGPWAVICPFNFPFGISMTMIVGTLLTGNTAIIKPSSINPVVCHALYDVLIRAGVPEGVLNLITGPGNTVGETLIKHEQIQGVVFTGSKDVGYAILKHISDREYPIPVILELGGKNAAIISDKADLQKAVRGVVSSAFGYSGQKCVACSRAYIHSTIFDSFVEMLIRETESFKVDDPRLRHARTGPLINEEALRKFEHAVSQAVKDGKILTGGHRRVEGSLSKGWYVEPTVVAGLNDSHDLVKTELFLPFLCVQEYRSLEDAVRRANAVPYGLTAGIYSEDKKEVDYFLDNIQSGMVFVNGIRGATNGAIIGTHSFGGWKGSGSTGRGSGDIYYLMQFMRQQGRAIGR
ncbi:MAG: aldehyde dehydrogenase family protein [Methanomassiliicoccales archaeon]